MLFHSEKSHNKRWTHWDCKRLSSPSGWSHSHSAVCSWSINISHLIETNYSDVKSKNPGFRKRKAFVVKAGKTSFPGLTDHQQTQFTSQVVDDCYKGGPKCAKSFQSCPTLCNPMDWFLCPWDSPDKNTGMDCHALLQGIFLTQGSNHHLMSPALAGKFFTTSATWDTIPRCSCSALLISFILAVKYNYLHFKIRKQSNWDRIIFPYHPTCEWQHWDLDPGHGHSISTDSS